MTRSGCKWSFGAVLLLTVFAVGTSGIAADKIKIEKLDDLPRYTYKIETPAVDFLKNDAAVMALAAEVKRDFLKDLETYQIDDKTTLKDIYQSLGTVALLEKDYDTYLSYLNKRIELEDKIATKLTSGLFTRAYIAAKKLGDEKLNERISAELTKLVQPLPYEEVEANLKQSKAGAEMMTENLVLGGIESAVQPILDGSKGEMSRDLAGRLLGSAYSLRYFIPYKEILADVYAKYIDAHQVEKTDIWAERDVTLTLKDKAKPVIMAVWDSGVDPEIFVPRKLMWTNEKEKPGNNKDDDNNGYVDDLHGIAYSLHSDKEISLLFDVGDVSTERVILQKRMKGLTDMQANIDSPEAKELRETLATLHKDSVKDMFEGVGKYGNYCHGTHVAGIAVRGNPFARVLAARITFDYHMIPELPTVEQARKDAKATEEVIDYFKQNGVRVVNMSWGGSLRDVEQALEANNAGGSPDERKALAREIYEITNKALFNAIKNAPDILFITSAGNADNDVVFEEFYPSSYDLPNIMSVGAVDQAGDETSFTSFGKVDVYANGFEVLSYVPGGDEMNLSGTSMSSPNVMNLAGKLLAMKPELTVAQLRKLIEDTTDLRKAGEREIRLMNPRRAFEMLAQM